MKETSKDVKNLNMSILDLAIALEQRAGVKTDKKDKQDTKEKKEKDPAFRNLGVDLKADLKDFTKGFVSTFTTNSFAERLVGKSEILILFEDGIIISPCIVSPVSLRYRASNAA